MKYLPDLKYRVNLSVAPYKSKAEGKASYQPRKHRAPEYKRVKGACFNERDVTSAEFLDYLVLGYSCAHIFNRKLEEWIECPNGKFFNKIAVSTAKWNNGALLTWAMTEDNFTSASLIMVDIDKTKFTDVAAYIQSLYFKPTFAYTTGSDTPKKRKFRLAYVLENPITDKDAYTHYAEIIKKMILNSIDEEMGDVCWLKCNQKYLGSYNANYTFISNLVYSFVDLEDYDFTHQMTVETPLFGEGAECRSYKKLDIPELDYDQRLLYNINKYSNDKTNFARYNWNYIFITRNENELAAGEYKVGDEIVLPKKMIQRGKRVRTLKERAALRRLITKDTITHNTLLFNFWLDRLLICEEYEDISIDEAKSTINCIMTLTMDDIKEKYAKTIEHHTVSFTTGKGTTCGEISKINSEVKANYIKANYNHELTVDENCKLLHVTKKTLIKWLKDNKIDKQSKIKEKMLVIKNNFNPELNVHANFNQDVIQSLNISYRTYLRYVKQLEKLSSDKKDEELNSICVDSTSTVNENKDTNMTNDEIKELIESIPKFEPTNIVTPEPINLDEVLVNSITLDNTTEASIPAFPALDANLVPVADPEPGVESTPVNNDPLQFFVKKEPAKEYPVDFLASLSSLLLKHRVVLITQSNQAREFAHLPHFNADNRRDTLIFALETGQLNNFIETHKHELVNNPFKTPTSTEQATDILKTVVTSTPKVTPKNMSVSTDCTKTLALGESKMSFSEASFVERKETKKNKVTVLGRKEEKPVGGLF